MRLATAVIPFVLTFAAACGDTTHSAVPSASKDTTLVNSKGEGAWGPAHEVVEVLRVPTNTKETTFGRIQGLEATADGGVFVFDGKSAEGAIIRRFDANGKFIRNIGREGHGPGEYSGEIVRINESNGVIATRDMSSINRFTSDGTFINSFAVGHSAGIIDVVQADDGSIYTTAPRATKILQMGERSPTQPVFHYDSAGNLLDSIGGAWLVTKTPVSQSMGPLRLYETRFALSDGRVIVGRSDMLGFLVIDPNRAPLIAKYDTPPVPYLSAERAELGAAQRRPIDIDGNGKGISSGGTAEVTRFKPPLMSIRPDADGRIWMMTPGPSTKLAEPRCNSFADGRCVGKTSYTQTNRLLGFSADGSFLGEIRFPKRSGSPSFRGDYVWSVRFDDDDVPFLVKYRLR